MGASVDWVQTSLHPLEYRATINGHACIIRTLRPKLVRWEAVVYDDTQPVHRTLKDTYWAARRWCEALAG